MMDSIAVRKQPPSTGDGEVVLNKVLQRIDHNIALADPKYRQCGQLMGGSTTEGLNLVKQALIVRAEMGKKKYGTMLRTNNGRNATVDMYQELLDAIMYAEQAYEEKMWGGHLVPILLSLACQAAQAIADAQAAPVLSELGRMGRLLEDE